MTTHTGETVGQGFDHGLQLVNGLGKSTALLARSVHRR